MPVYKINKLKLEPLSKRKFDLERDIQKLTEQNLGTLFGLRFVSGASNQEFHIPVQEQEFYIDTLAFDEGQKSFVIIEYKKDRSFSVIDQGFAYLSAILNHPADLILELNERLGKSFKKSDIDWDASRVIFISPEFTNYQKNAINFKDLPFYLYEVDYYSGDIIDYSPIKPYQTSVSVTHFIKDPNIQKVAKEIKVYTIDDLIRPDWTDIKELYDELSIGIMKSGIETREKFTKVYVAYMSKHGRNYVELVPQQKEIKVYFRFPYNFVKSSMKIEDIRKIGHLANGISYVHYNDTSQVPEIIRLAKESYRYLHKDIVEKYSK
jgi:predicted transport protein